MALTLSAEHKMWPIAGRFAISRGSKTTADVVVATVRDGDVVGRGECVPYWRYGERIDSVVAQLAAVAVADMTRRDVQSALPAGAARNALDCAFWDLEAKRSGARVWTMIGLDLAPLTTAYTLSLDAPDAMAANARANAHMPLLKLKLAGPGDLDRVAAVRAGAPNARLIVDANEGWTPAIYAALAPKLIDLGVEMIEQPLPADQDGALAEMDRPIPVCADESCHDRASLKRILGKYDLINIKLDKAGGLTEALALKRDAEAAGLGVMVGCMVGSSLAMAPAMIVAQGAKVVDLDGPLLLAADDDHAIQFENGVMAPPDPALWG